MSIVSYPYTIGWGITNKCNYNCKHCNMDSGYEDDEELSFDESCTLIDEFEWNYFRKLTNKLVILILTISGTPLFINSYI